MIRFIPAAALLVLTFVGCGGEDSAGTAQVDYSTEGPDGPNVQEEFSETESGLQYRILREGSGSTPSLYDKVSVSYRGWLDDESEFDSSYPRKSPTEFGLNQVIPGWTEGLQLVKEGGKIELIIPSELGYGPLGMPPDIPPDAQLHFIVELHEVK